MEDFWFAGFLFVLVVVVLYVTVIYPRKTQERIVLEDLRTYQMEFQTGVKSNKLESLLKDNGYQDELTKELGSKNGKDN